MKKLAITGLLLLLTTTTWATDYWKFELAIAVTETPAEGIFVHLEGAGRKHVAVSESKIAVVWEDNRNGSPQTYLSTSSIDKSIFSIPVQLSNGSESYEPTIAHLSKNRFIAVWEQDSEIYMSVIDNAIKPPIKLSNAAASHASVVTNKDSAFVVWRKHKNSEWFLKVAALEVNADGKVAINSVRTIEKDGVQFALQMPSISYNEAGLMVAWEDRREGHTRILHSVSHDQGSNFSKPQPLNEYFSDRNQYDKGNGVTRVSVHTLGEDEIIAAWMDKRRGGKGYGIFAALGSEGGIQFGPNEKVHSQPGDALPHYNPATAGNQIGEFAIAWDDYRNGNLDIWISNYNEDEEWTVDFSPEVASGENEQSHPSIFLDENGLLHLLWMERETPFSPGQLWYSQGIPATNTD